MDPNAECLGVFPAVPGKAGAPPHARRLFAAAETNWQLAALPPRTEKVGHAHDVPLCRYRDGIGSPMRQWFGRGASSTRGGGAPPHASLAERVGRWISPAA